MDRNALTWDGLFEVGLEISIFEEAISQSLDSCPRRYNHEVQIKSASWNAEF